MTSGAAVARLFHRLLAAIFLIAWLSLGVQVRTLIGSDGLLPADVGDGPLVLGVIIGAGLSISALAGRWPRVCIALATVLYLGYASLCRTFLSFQWDNLIIECGALAAFLPRHRRAPLVHFIFLGVLFKLYWESGVAKWQSHLHDWHDGSAMTYYYETAPLPTAGAWFAHQLPAWWHHFESRATLGFELVLPLGAFVPVRRVRLACAGALTGFQLINAATANYGFFCWLACALHVFLLDEEDLVRAHGWLRKKLKREPSQPRFDKAVTARAWLWTSIGEGLLLFIFVACSTVEGLVHFVRNDKLLDAVAPIREVYAPFRVFNAYHLFGHITRERIEPEFQTLEGGRWSARDLRFKPGDLSRRPRFVAPHQPRVDFQLWFYGLDYARGTPAYVVNLLDRLCHKPDAVQSLFLDPLPAHPDSVRIVFWDYHFTRSGEAGWWKRTQRDETRAISCK
jgi:lipase maturation factor 1